MWAAKYSPLYFTMPIFKQHWSLPAVSFSQLPAPSACQRAEKPLLLLFTLTACARTVCQAQNTDLDKPTSCLPGAQRDTFLYFAQFLRCQSPTNHCLGRWGVGGRQNRIHLLQCSHLPSFRLVLPPPIKVWFFSLPLIYFNRFQL